MALINGEIASINNDIVNDIEFVLGYMRDYMEPTADKVDDAAKRIEAYLASYRESEKGL